jgi:hypothetical protein
MTVLAVTAVAGLKHTPTANLATTQQARGTGVIIGRVVDADSGQPIPGAIVQLNVTPAAPAQGQGASALVGSSGAVAIVGNGGGTIQINQNGPDNPQTRVLTDADGQFAFRDIAAGQCRFVVEAQGYSGGGYHQVQVDGPSEALDVAADQHVTDVALKMWKEAVITGRVLDEAGEPVVGVFVRVLRRTVVGGQTTVQLSGAGRETDDRGVYRSSGLRPGDYLVEVPTTRMTMPIAAFDTVAQNQQGNPSAAGVTPVVVAGGVASAESGQQVGNLLLSNGGIQSNGDGMLAPAATSDGRLSTYPTIFYPSASLSTRATAITLHSGEEKSGIDIQLALLPAFRISGVITDTDGRPAPSMALHLASLDDQNNVDTVPDEVATSVSDPHGEFTILAVSAGQYLLTALRSPAGAGLRGGGAASSGADSAPPAWAKASVSIADKDVTGLALTLRAGLNVAGHVVFDGDSPRPTGPQLGRGIRLQPTGSGSQSGGRGGVASNTVAQINADGSFAMSGAMPGKYMILGAGWPVLKWKVKSINADGRDVSDLPIDLDSGDLLNVVVTFTDRPGALAGTVRRSTGEPDPSALVVGFPVDPHAWGSSGIHTFSTHVTSTGTYSVPSISPGEYSVAAISDALAQTWQSPDVLQRIAASAARVRVEDGAHATQDLTTSTIR